MVFCRFYNGGAQEEHCPFFREVCDGYGEIEYRCVLGIKQKEKVYEGYYEPFCNLPKDKVEQFLLEYNKLQSKIHELQNFAVKEEKAIVNEN